MTAEHFETSVKKPGRGMAAASGDKKRDPRYRLIEPTAWARCDLAQRAEQESLKHVLDQWGAGDGTKQSA
jgi:hypothetical protein